MTPLEALAREIDTYAGAAGDMDPAIGMTSMPVRLFAALRRILRAMDEEREASKQ